MVCSENSGLPVELRFSVLAADNFVALSTRGSRKVSTNCLSGWSTTLAVVAHSCPKAQMYLPGLKSNFLSTLQLRHVAVRLKFSPNCIHLSPSVVVSVPVVTKRAYAIAGLPIPSLWGNSPDSIVAKQGPASHPNGSLNGALSSSNCATNNTTIGNTVGASGRISSSTVSGTVISKRVHNSITDTTSADPGRKNHFRAGVGGIDEEVELADETVNSSDGPLSRSRSTAHQDENNALMVVFSGEESGQSNETGAGAVNSNGPRRSGASHMCLDEEIRTDDEAQSVQSGTGGTINVTRTAAVKNYDIDPDVDTDDDDDQAVDGDGDDDAEMDEELDDVEWIQSTRRRSTRSFTSRRAFNTSRASRALAKSTRFGLSGGRMSGRHISSGQRSLSGRQKVSIPTKCLEVHRLIPMSNNHPITEMSTMSNNSDEKPGRKNS